jgi:homogentisate 1,2-dioxygenase
MPHYLSRGRIPKKRHTVFKKEDGSLHFEELVSREGFSSVYSNMYHLRMPTQVKKVGAYTPAPRVAAEGAHRLVHVRTARLPAGKDPVTARHLLFFNSDVAISKAHVSVPPKGTKAAPSDPFFRNGHHDELLYVQKGSGTLRTQVGDLAFAMGDYLVIPRSITWQMDFDGSDKAGGGDASLLVVESGRPIQFPRRYVNNQGQLLEHAPFCERDIRFPTLAPPKDEAGDFKLLVKLEGGTQEYTLANHPFDVVGWDGCLYPWALSIKDFEPIVGSIHQPPPVHQTFEAPGFVVCSFVSRPFDFHKDAIPAPYPHSNIDSDELLFYSTGNFMSRRGIEEESITFHPSGLAHGPHPGKYEESVGKKYTDELAVMIDTFKPLMVAQGAAAIDDGAYPQSWLG